MIRKRSDFLYMAYDLRGHDLTRENPQKLPGVTLAPPLFYRGPRPNLEREPKFLLTFMGSLRKRGRQGGRHPRMMLNRTVEVLNAVPGVVIEFVHPRADALMGGLTATSRDEKARYDELMDSAFVLMLRGVDRWTYRFSEAVGACAIPVLLNDGRGEGATLPFEELIDWRTATVQIGEKLGMSGEQRILNHLVEHPLALLESLPSSPEEVRAMRRRVCDINDRFFATRRLRAESALRSAAAAARAHAGQLFPKQ